jgi:asparagine synthase (glutamine-hydrolysing)
MCGFVGVISEEAVTQIDREEIVEMNGFISHRGPDNIEYHHDEKFACGFSRLAIVDLDQRANQPMFDQTGQFVLLYNGEVYNSDQLRKELEILGHSFTTTSDTEVVLKSFIEWNVKCVEKFQGMFAFVIFDLKSKNTYLFRDQLGIKPLYFMNKKNKFYFSSELKVFLKISRLNVNADKLEEYTAFGNIAGEQTLFKDIFILLPGHYMILDHKNKSRKVKYYDLTDSFDGEKNNFSSEDLEKMLANSIVDHTMSDVGYGVQLSGGLDSSYVVAMLKKDKVATFSIGLDGCNELDESKYQNICSKYFNTTHHPYRFENKDFLRYLIKSIWYFDYPLHHPNIVSMFILCEKAKEEGVKVLLSGDGADEIFCGYRWQNEDSQDIDLDSVIKKSAYNQIGDIDQIFEGLSYDFSERKDLIRGEKDLSKATLILDQKLYLQKWLQRQDRMGMASSVEIRVPFCNTEILKLINPLSFEDKTNHKKDPKFLLKKIAEKYLPKDLVWRDKVGFGIPLEDWFREDGGLFSCLSFLQDETFKKRGICFVSFVGCQISSQSKNAIYSPFAFVIAKFRASPKETFSSPRKYLSFSL